MNFFFNLPIEFDKDVVDNSIFQSIENGEKGYICVIDGNVLANSFIDENYRNIIRSSKINVCDGSSIAKMVNIIYGEKFSTYTGPKLFANFLKSNSNQLFLGNTNEIHNILRDKFIQNSISLQGKSFIELPFANVEDFDYYSISKSVNFVSPDIIWVSLGAPKQELFISKLYPLINKGVLIAIGAAFNLYVEDNRESSIVLKLNLEWLLRSIKSPRRIGVRAIKYLKLLPKIFLSELKNKYFNKRAKYNETTRSQR